MDFYPLGYFAYVQHTLAMYIYLYVTDINCFGREQRSGVPHDPLYRSRLLGWRGQPAFLTNIWYLDIPFIDHTFICRIQHIRSFSLSVDFMDFCPCAGTLSERMASIWNGEDGERSPGTINCARCKLDLDARTVGILLDGRMDNKYRTRLGDGCQCWHLNGQASRSCFRSM